MTGIPILCLFLLHLSSNIFAAEDNSNLLPDNTICGMTRDSKIVGGQLTGLNEFPWMALIAYDTPSGRSFHCGGSLISKRYILTAGHCVNKVPKTWTIATVRLGENDLNQEIDCESDRPGIDDCADEPIDVGVEATFVHEQYDPNTISQHHDIALLRLNKDVNFSEWVSPICLPTTAEIREKDFAGADLFVSGWGSTETSPQSNLKLKVDVPVKSDSECISKYLRGANVQLIANQLCAGGVKGKDSCTGDSGGPLMVLNRTPKEDNWYAIAIVSFGPTNCGLQNWPGVYTKVTPYMPWILSKMKP